MLSTGVIHDINEGGLDIMKKGGLDIIIISSESEI